MREWWGAEGPGSPGAKREAQWVTVVGVANDTRVPALHGDRRWVQIYSFMPPKVGDVPILMRTQKHGPDVTLMMERAIANADRRIVVRPALSGDAYLRDSLAPT